MCRGGIRSEHVNTIAQFVMLFYFRIKRIMRRNWIVPVWTVLLLLVSESLVAQSLELDDLPTGIESTVDFEDRYVRYRPAFAMNGFDCSESGAMCDHGLGLKQILEELAREGREAELVQALFDLADENLEASSDRKGIARNSQRAQALGFVALATLVLEQNGYDLSDLGLDAGPVHSEVMAGINRIATNLPVIEINDDISDDAVKWVGTLGNLTRFVDQYLALERAYSHYGLDGGATFTCETKSALLNHLEQQFRLVGDLGNRGLVDLDFLKPIGLPSNISGADYDEVQAGNWSMKVHATVGYATLGQQVPLEGSSCSGFIPEEEEMYTHRIERAFRSTGPNDNPQRKHHWAFQTNNGKRFWAEGAFYFNYGLASVLPFWQTVRAQQIEGFDWKDPFKSDWFLEPLRGYAETVDPNGFVPPLDDGNKIPMEAAFMMRWDGSFSTDATLGKQFAWIAAAQEELPGEDNWLNILLLPTATEYESPVSTLAPGTVESEEDPHNIILRRDGGTGNCELLPENRTSPCHYVLVNGEPQEAIKPGEGHEQSDQLQLLYYVDGQSFIMDAGYDNAPGIKNSTWSAYPNHNVMTVRYTNQDLGHGGLPGPMLGIDCPIVRPCEVGMFADHDAVETLTHETNGRVDKIQGQITLETDTNPDTAPTRIVYERTVLFIDDPLRPYMIDINGGEWIRPDGEIPDLPTYEMLYHAAPSTIDFGDGRIIQLGNGSVDELGEQSEPTGHSLFINRFAIDGAAPYAVQDTLRESSVSGLDRGEGTPAWRLGSRSEGTGNGSVDFTSIAFIQPQVAGLDRYSCSPNAVMSLENGNREGDAGVYAWESSANTVDIVFVRSASFPIGLPYTMEPNLASLVDPNDWEVDEDFLTNGLTLDHPSHEVVLEAGNRAGFVRYRRIDEVEDCVSRVSVSNPAPSSFTISPNFPNPVGHTTTFTVSLDVPDEVKVEVFDLLGRRVQQVMDQQLSSGEHQVVWDASQVPAGSYMVRFQVGERVLVRRVAVL